MLNHSNPNTQTKKLISKPGDESRPTVLTNRRRLVDWSNSPRVLLAGSVASLVFFALTSPKLLPPPMLIAGFIALGLFLYCVIKLIMIAMGLQTRQPAMYLRLTLLVGTVLPVILLVMQSVGQLTIRDIVTIGCLFGVGVFYVSRVRRSR